MVVILFFRKPPVRRTTGDWTAATEVEQEMFSHLALISVELAKSFWPRKLSAAPIGVFFKLQVVHEQEAARFLGRLLIQPAQLLLRQQGAQLLDDGVQLVLVAQPPAALTRTAALMLQHNDP